MEKWFKRENKERKGKKGGKKSCVLVRVERMFENPSVHFHY